MADIKETLSKKVGPLPLGVWLLAVGGGLGLSYYVQRGSDEEEVVEDEEFAFDQYSGDAFTAQPYSGEVGLPDFGTQAPISQPPQTINSNAQWIALGVDYLIGIGASPLKANDALVKFTEGQVVDTQEQALVSQVIRHLGAPPESAPSSDPGDTPEPADQEPGTQVLQFHTSVPIEVKQRFSGDQVANALFALKVPGVGPRWINDYDIRKGLKKLGYTTSADLKVNVENVKRLVNFQRASKTTKKPTSKSSGYYWGPIIPKWVKNNLSANAAQRSLVALRVPSSNRLIGAWEIRRGLVKLGYKKKKNLKATGQNINRLIKLTRAKKGQ